MLLAMRSSDGETDTPAYADDLVILVERDRTDFSRRPTNLALQICADWCQEEGLNI